MTGNDYDLLKEEVRLLRVAIEELEKARASDTTQEKLAELTNRVDLMSTNMDKRFSEILRLLSGNGGDGVVDVLDHMIRTLRAMGGVVGDMHRGEQMSNDVLERILAKLKFEDILLTQLRAKEINSMRQAVAMAQE